MCARTTSTAVLAVVVTLLFSSATRAADYAVKIAAATEAGQETSSLICWFDHTCHGELKEVELQVDIDLRRALPRIARLRLHGRRPGCCYFERGRDETAIDLNGVTVHREPIFKGTKANGGVIVENERIGSLYLNFRLVTPDRDDRKSLDRPI